MNKNTKKDEDKMLSQPTSNIYIQNLTGDITPKQHKKTPYNKLWIPNLGQAKKEEEKIIFF